MNRFALPGDHAADPVEPAMANDGFGSIVGVNRNQQAAGGLRIVKQRFQRGVDGLGGINGATGEVPIVLEPACVGFFVRINERARKKGD